MLSMQNTQLLWIKIIKEETQKDNQLQKLSTRILTDDWEQHKKYPDIMPSMECDMSYMQWMT